MAKIALAGVSRKYGEALALDDVSLEIAEGEFLTLLGPSGCGKTTALRIVAGFVSPTAGKVLMNGEDVTGRPPQRRNVGMVFQDYALFPHLTVAENIGFGLKARGVDKARIKARVAELLSLVQLERLAERRPAQLSGGQQQRVALARAVAHPPSVLLMDEPFTALDRKLRETLQLEVRRIQRSLGITTIFVTHDQAEALSLSDRIALLNEGRVVQAGAPEDIYGRPASRFAAGFLGQINLLEGEIAGECDGWSIFRTGGRALGAPLPAKRGAAALGVRPEHVRVISAAAAGTPSPSVNRITGVMAGRIYEGGRIRLLVHVGEAEWTAEIQGPGPAIAEGEPTTLEWDRADSLVLDR